MSEKTIENNKVSVIGKIVSGFTFSHEVFGEGFYLVDLEVNRLSDQADVIPLMISERLLNVSEDYIGCTVEAIGQFRSYNRHEGARNRLVLSVFVREINFMEEFVLMRQSAHASTVLRVSQCMICALLLLSIFLLYLSFKNFCLCTDAHQNKYNRRTLDYIHQNDGKKSHNV